MKQPILPEKFKPSGKVRKLSLVLIALGLVLFVIGIFVHRGAEGANQRIWANVLLNGAFFTAVSAASLFLIAAHTIAYGGWQTLVKRIFEAVAQYIPYGLVLLLLVVLGTWGHWHHLYHWTDSMLTTQETTVGELKEYESHLKYFHIEEHAEGHHDTKAEAQYMENPNEADLGEIVEDAGTVVEGEMNPDAATTPVVVQGELGHSAEGGNHGKDHKADEPKGYGAGFDQVHHATTIPAQYAQNYEGMAEDAVIKNPHFDHIMNSKTWYLPKWFWTARYIVYALLLLFFLYTLRRLSTWEDALGGLKNYKKMKVFAAGFLIVYAVFSSVSSWDWIMSIDAHWFSTMFGWYNFASAMVTAVAVVLLTTILLKEAGYLRYVNQEHIHDLGKYMFAFSVFWTYLWFCQYMLYWYANIPEETVYFQKRVSSPYFSVLFWGLLFVNFVFPFLTLMTRGAKRSFTIVKVVAIVVILGHFLDFYTMIMPGALQITDKAGRELANYAGFGLLEIGLFMAMIGGMIYVVSNALSKASLVPTNDPFVHESAEHHVL